MIIRLPCSLVASWPGIYATDGVPEDERLVVAKFFNPAGAGTWFVLEADALTDPEAEIWVPLAQAVATGVRVHDVKFFGLVTGLGSDELGYFLLSDLEAYRGPLGIGIELDAYFEPVTLAAVRGCKAAWAGQDVIGGASTAALRSRAEEGGPSRSTRRKRRRRAAVAARDRRSGGPPSPVDASAVGSGSQVVGGRVVDA